MRTSVSFLCGFHDILQKFFLSSYKMRSLDCVRNKKIICGGGSTFSGMKVTQMSPVFFNPPFILLLIYFAAMSHCSKHFMLKHVCNLSWEVSKFLSNLLNTFQVVEKGCFEVTFNCPNVGGEH